MLHTKTLTGVIREWSEVAMQRSMRDFRQFIEVTGLSFSQISILMRLAHHGNASVTEVGEQLGVSNAAASQAVDRLVVMGLVQRTEDPEDRRLKHLALSEKGQAMIEKGVEARSQWIEGVTDSLNPEQQNMILTALTLLTEAAKQTSE